MRNKWIILCLALLFSVPRLIAQTNTADVVGTVTDATGAVVPDAKVIATNIGTGISHAQETSKRGEFTFTMLQVGTYQVTIEAKGFKTFKARDLKVSAGDRARLDAKLDVGSTTESVQVTADASATLHTDTAEVSAIVPETSVQDAPLNGRNLISLVQVSPGVTTNSGQSAVNGQTRGGMDDGRQTSSYSVNAQPDVSNNNMIDGMDNNDRRLGVIEVKPSIDAIQEVKVSTNLYSAENGRTGGGVVEIITKSGTNNFHGSAYEYIRNDALDAKNYFWTSTSGKPILRQNQFGGSYGGPVRKNKTFFFADVEFFRKNQPQQNNQSVPDLVTTADGQNEDGTFVNARTVHLKDLLASGTAFNLVEGTSFTSGLDPSTLVRNLLSLYPDPSLADGSICKANTQDNYCSSNAYKQNSWTFDTRIDQHFNDRNTLYGRVSYNQTVTDKDPTFPAKTVNGVKVVQGGIKQTQPQFGLALDYTHTVRSNLVVDLKAGYTYSKNFYAPSDPSGIATSLGFMCNDVYCVNSPSLPASMNGIPSISLNYGQTQYGGLGEGGFAPLLVKNHSFQYSSSLTWTRGNHNVKVGVALVRRQLMGAQAFAEYGQISVQNFTAFLEGQTTSKGRTALSVTPHYRMYEPSAYIQDNWRVNGHLTLNLGVRYDIFPPYSEKNGYVSNFDPTAPVTVDGVNYNGMIVSPVLLGTQHSTGTGNVKTYMGQVAPRVGFAESLGHDIVVRGGFGVTFSPNSAGGPNTSMTNAPFVYSVTCGASQGGPGKNGSPIPWGSGLCPTEYQSLETGIRVPTALLDQATNPLTYAAQSINSLDTHLKPSELFQFSLMAEKAWRSNVFSIGYVGSLGRHMPSFVDINQPTDMTQTYPFKQFTVYTDSNNNLQMADNNMTPKMEGDALAAAAAAHTPGTSYQTPALMENVTGGISRYNSMQATFMRRAGHGLTLSLNYSWAHAISNSSFGTEGYGVDPSCSLGCVVDPGPGSSDRTPKVSKGYQEYDLGNSLLDIRHRAAGIINYQLPFFRNQGGIVGIVAKGWMANLMGSINSGSPFSIVNSFSGPGAPPGVTYYTQSGLLTHYNGSERPNQVCNAKKSHPTLDEWVNVGCFQLQEYGTWGNERANQLYGPGGSSLNLSLVKEFNLVENMKLQFRAEAYNALNHPVFDVPGMTAGQSNYTSTNCNVGDINNSCMDIPVVVGSVQRGGGFGPPGNYPGAVLNTAPGADNRQLQFALRLSF